MAPEQRETGGHIPRRSMPSVWLSEILTGARVSQLAESDGSGSSVKLPDGIRDPRWKRAIHRCLQKRPEDRFKKIDEVLTSVGAAEEPLRVD